MWSFKALGCEISISNGYVKVSACHEAHEKLEHSLDIRFAGTNKRIDDLSGKLDMAIGLLKK